MDIYRSQMRVANRVLNDVEHLNEEFFHREICMKIIRDLPYDELKKIFKLTVTNGFGPEADINLCDPNYPPHLKEKIIMLRDSDTAEYEVEVEIP